MLLLGAVLALAVATPTPAPAPPRLPAIAHVRSTAMCAAFRQQVLPSVGDVLQNDKLIDDALLLFTSLAADAENASEGRAMHPWSSTDDDGRMVLDQMRLDLILHGITVNLQHVDTLQLQAADVQKKERGQPAEDLAEMHDRLAAIQTRQQRELNVIGGLLSTQQLGDLQAAGDNLEWVTMPEIIPRTRKDVYGAVQPTPDPNLGAAHTNDAGLIPLPGDRWQAQRVTRKTQTGVNNFTETSRILGPADYSVHPDEMLLAFDITTAAQTCGLVTPQPGTTPGTQP